MKRTQSSNTIALRKVEQLLADDMEGNINTAWMYKKRVAFLYVLGVAVARIMLSFVEPAYAWTITNILHSALTFVFLHWVKGVPFAEGFANKQGKYDALTLWEQLDKGEQYTPTRKFLTVIPILLFVIAIHQAGSDPYLLLANTAFTAPVLIGKLARMHKVRILGVNR
eukprot:TRINITY_DN13_c1_g1_i1.p1 TRINITY_DN13_c1_g1~~TRINITY_DN13_c1_g1_i1.p1  ORF type:complete len:168 (-),score=24.59 TRINITY_DN13_c1_g1_i1:285-788(-)